MKFSFINLILGLLLIFGLNAYANAQSVPTLGDIAQNLTNTFEAITRLITAVAYVSGSGLFLISIFQFRQHKENPTQIPLSKPMMFLALGSALLFFPTIIEITEHSVFGTNAITGGPQGLIITA